MFIISDNINGSFRTFLDIINNFGFKTLVVKGCLPDEFLKKWDNYISMENFSINSAPNEALVRMSTKRNADPDLKELI